MDKLLLALASLALVAPIVWEAAQLITQATQVIP
jgi:hypothetical protein